MEPLPPEIVDYYRSSDEAARLRDGVGPLEFLRVQEIVRRFLPPGTHRIADIGGATGVHARWLADDGHEVRIFDVVAAHVEAALALASDRPSVSAEVADARSLPAQDGSFDAALLLGPLYHLTTRDDRLLALREAARVVRPAGVVFVAAISRFASLFDGLTTGSLFDDDFAAIVKHDLASGHHRNPGQRQGWFTTAYFHRPDQLRQECLDAGLEVSAVLGVEGLAGWLPQLTQRWGSPTDRGVILDSARVVEAEETLLGLSPHLMAVARVP